MGRIKMPLGLRRRPRVRGDAVGPPWRPLENAEVPTFRRTEKEEEKVGAISRRGSEKCTLGNVHPGYKYSCSARPGSYGNGLVVGGGDLYGTSLPDVAV